MAWTTQGTAVANAVIASAFWNTMVRDDSTFLFNKGGILQRVVAASSTASFTGSSTTYADITNATLSITTAGGRLLIYCIPAAAQESYFLTQNTAGAGNLSYVKCFIGATDAGAFGIATALGASGTGEVGPWSNTPASGTYTVKLQYKISAATQTFAANQKLLVCEEWSL